MISQVKAVTYASIALLLLLGCKQEENHAPTSQNQSAAVSPTEKKTDEKKVRGDKIYIDSVPDGAEVWLMPREENEKKEKKKKFGKTPLVLNAAEAPTMLFLS